MSKIGEDGVILLELLPTPLKKFHCRSVRVHLRHNRPAHGSRGHAAQYTYDTLGRLTDSTQALDGLTPDILLGYHRFFTEIRGLPGSDGFLGNYSNRTYTSRDPLDWTIFPGEGLVADQETGSWTLAYFLDQMVWVDCCNEKRNIHLFSIWSLADGNPNPYRWSGNVTLQGSGLIRGRESDTMGVGYLYDGLSSDFKALMITLPAIDIQDIQGVELYYNAALTPWFHLTGDLQIIDNQNVADDTAIILGLRANVDL